VIRGHRQAIIVGTALAATLGLAMLVRQARLLLMQVSLAPPRQMGAIVAALPDGWTPRHIDGGILAQEPAAAGHSRRLSIVRHTAPSMRDPLEHLASLGVIGRPWRTAPVKLGGWPGIMVDDAMHAWESGRPPPRMVVAAAAVLPSGEAAVVWLEGPGAVSAADVQLVRRVCASLELHGAPPAEPAEQLLELDGQTVVQIPEGFLRAPPDAFRIGRQILRADRWLAAELVPCPVLDEDPSQEFAVMLQYRDRTLQWGQVRRIEAGVYRSVRVGREAADFPAVATLLVGPAHTGLLVEVRMRAGEERSAEELWEMVRRPLRLAGNQNTLLMLANGLELADGIRNAWWAGGGLEARQTWLWRDGFSAAVLCSEMQYASDDAQAWGARRDVDRDGAVVAERRWRSDRQGYQYAAGERKYIQTGDGDERWAPGGWLMTALGGKYAGPAIIRSESFVDEAGPVPGLLTLSVEESVDVPRQMDGEPEPMRCLSVTVGGSGRLSRWYYDQAGELRYVDFAHGVHLWREK